MSITKSIVFFWPIVATPIDHAHLHYLMCTTGLVEIVNIIGLSLYRRLQMLGTCGVCAPEHSSFYQVLGKSEVVPSLI